MYHKTNHLADMDRGFIESSAFDRDAIIALATDPHWSDEARVRSIALTVAVDQGHAAAAVRAQQPPCCEVTGRSVEHDRPGGRRRGRLGRGAGLAAGNQQGGEAGGAAYFASASKGKELKLPE
jgi:hypothetical protein